MFGIEDMFLICNGVWRNNITSTCLVSLFWVKSSRCTWLPTLVVIGLIEIEISVLASTLTWIPRKKQNSFRQFAILKDCQNQGYRFTIPKSRTRLAEKGEEKALCVSSKRNKYLGKYWLLYHWKSFKIMIDQKRFMAKKLFRIPRRRHIILFTDWVIRSVNTESSYVKNSLGRYWLP